MNRYADKYKRFAVDPAATAPRPETAQDKATTGSADFMRFLGDIAPGAGTVLGGVAGGLLGGIPTGGVGAIPGATAGAALGNSLGQAAGTMLGSGAEAMEAPREDEERAKKEERDSRLAMLMGLRR